jgi:hypothetical protein
VEMKSYGILLLSMNLTKSISQQSAQHVAGPPTCSLGLAALSARTACLYSSKYDDCFVNPVGSNFSPPRQNWSFGYNHEVSRSV